MSKITPPPIKEDMFARPGVLSRVWTMFFQKMHDAVQTSANGNSDEAAVMAAMETPVRDESRNIEDLNKQVALLPGLKDYDAKIAEIEKLLAMLPGAIDFTKRIDELESKLNFSSGPKDHSGDIEELRLLSAFIPGTSEPRARNAYIAINDADRTNATLTDDYIVAFTALTATRNYQISSADIAQANRMFIIKDESGAAGTSAITVSTEGAEKIDGADTISINSNYGSVTLYSNGSNLFIT